MYNRPRMPRLALGLALVSLPIALGCSSSSTPSDAGIDAFVPGETDSGPADAGQVAVDGGGCDVGTPPDPLPEVTGGFAVDDPDAGSSVPVPAGGDPIGLWVFDTATFWVAPGAAAMFDEDTSTVDGTAWLEVTATEFALDWRFVTTLMGTLGGTIVRPSSTQIRATYTLDGASFVPDPICAQSSAGAASDGGTAGMSMLSFTQSGDSITAISRVSGPTGMITIVLEGTRRAR